MMVVVTGTATATAGSYAAAAAAHGLGSVALAHAAGFIYAGYFGLGALWIASFKKFGGRNRFDDYGDYGDYGYGYGGYGGGGYGGGGYGGGGYEGGGSGGRGAYGGGGGYSGGGGYGGRFPGRYAGGYGSGGGGYGDGLGFDGFNNIGDNFSKGHSKGHHKGGHEYQKGHDGHAVSHHKSHFQASHHKHHLHESHYEATRDRPLLREEWEILAFVWNGDELFDQAFPGQGIGPTSEALRDYKEAAYLVWGAYSGLAHGALGLVYSASFLNAGFIGLGALWLASYLGHGGFGGVIGDDYGDYDYYGGYGDYGGGYGGYKDQKGGYGHRPSYGAPSPYGNRGRIGGSSRHGKNNKRNSEWIRKKRSTDIAEGGYIHGDIRRSKGRKYRRTRNEEEIIVDELKRRDANGCSMRLVCEISAVKFRALRKEEWDILQFVRYTIILGGISTINIPCYRKQ
ncbi:hypothetical protein HAZT_HAZT010694 [Hyalella azteca]|uniref:Uncharacterized protein n=1 Tax=Hyalella azteca TaxID=294128 RepID=A0A6A0HCF9_HYAAZ|nr:hypothetical protein HAZT_HAZT010694 [Hyalella azteca]